MPMPSNDTEPIHRVRVDGFWMDATTVTNEQFEKFVKATGYVTIAERVPTKEELPDAPPENLVAGAVVFTPTNHDVPLDDPYQWWRYVKGANWRHPLGPQSDINGKEKYPVVQIAYPDAEAYAKQLLYRVGLGHKLHAYPDQLSGGQQQRVAIARALALRPDIVLLDEVTSALDPELVNEVLDVIRLLAADGMTIFFVSHEMAFVREVSSKVIFMADGNVVESGTPAQIFDSPEQPRTRDFVSKILRH